MITHVEQQPSSDELPLFVSVPQAARLLGIGATLAWELVRVKAIPSVKLGRRVLVSRSALEELAQSQTISRQAPAGIQSGDQAHHTQRRRSDGPGEHL